METCIGHVTHYFTKISVAVLSLTGEVQLDDTLHILGRDTDLLQKVWSMEVNHQKIQLACPGMQVAIRVAGPVHRGDRIFLVTGVSSEEIHNLLLSRMEERDRE